jgi:ketosteroid isomerase-like protein
MSAILARGREPPSAVARISTRGDLVIERRDALELAQEWLDAWNAHDPERVVAHFADDVRVRSPLADRLRPGSNGVLRGKDSVLSYYRDGLAAVPDLRFTLVEVCVGVDEVTIVYRNQRDALVTEAFTLGEAKTATDVRVSYGA